MRRKARPSGVQPWMKQECDLDMGLWDNANSGTTSDAEQDNTLSSAVSSKSQVYCKLVMDRPTALQNAQRHLIIV